MTAVGDLLAPSAVEQDKPDVVGDSAYADGDTRNRLGQAGYTLGAKVPPTRNRAGRFSKDHFEVNVGANTVTCPADVTVTIGASADPQPREPTPQPDHDRQHEPISPDRHDPDRRTIG